VSCLVRVYNTDNKLLNIVDRILTNKFDTMTGLLKYFLIGFSIAQTISTTHAGERVYYFIGHLLQQFYDKC